MHLVFTNGVLSNVFKLLLTVVVYIVTFSLDFICLPRTSSTPASFIVTGFGISFDEGGGGGGRAKTLGNLEQGGAVMEIGVGSITRASVEVSFF